MNLNQQKVPQLNLPWVNSPFFEKLLELSNLDEETKKIVKHYADYGYAIINPEIENFDEVSQRIIEALAPEYKGNGRIQDAWVFNEHVKKLALAPKVLSLLKILYQREPIPFQTLNFPVGTQQSTHSDTIHFHSVPAEFMCGVWVALEDVDANNGPLHYYPKSHKLPIFDLQHLGLTANGSKSIHENYAAYDQFLQYFIQHLKLEKTEVSLRKGQAIIWSANLLHGGSPILDPSRTRHSQVTHYFFSDCIYYTPLLSDLFLKKIYIREINNIANGETVPHIYNGEQVTFREFSEHQELLDSYKIIQEELLQAKSTIASLTNSNLRRIARSALHRLKQVLLVSRN
jgi:hypothetical protein